MDYEILERLVERSETNRENYQTKYNKFIKSGLEKLEEPWTGSDDTINAYFYHNYFRENGPIDLIVIVKEIDEGKKMGDFALRTVQSAIYPLYMTKDEEAIDIPAEEPAPKLHPNVIKFILEHRNRPKKKIGEEFNPDLHKWDINKLAQELNMSNRIIAQYCRAKNI